jgi:uncharacterized protein YqfA (UPF0365 family)
MVLILEVSFASQDNVTLQIGRFVLLGGEDTIVDAVGEFLVLPSNHHTDELECAFECSATWTTVGFGG